jgi:hypothetical protein
MPSDAAPTWTSNIDPVLRALIHLVNGKLTTNRRMTPAEGGDVRVRLDTVEGWLIGTLNLPT